MPYLVPPDVTNPLALGTSTYSISLVDTCCLRLSELLYTDSLFQEVVWDTDNVSYCRLMHLR